MKQTYRKAPFMVSLFFILLFGTLHAQGAATFSFNPSSPVVGETVTVQVTDSSPWAYVNVQAIGPNTVTGDWVGVNNNGNGTWTWTWTFTGLQAAHYAVRFTSDNYQQVRGETSLSVGGVNGASFTFNPASPTAGEMVTVSVTDSSPWAYVNVRATGPNTVDGTWVGVNNNGNGTWTWTWTFSGLQAGHYGVQFTSDNYQHVRGHSSLTVQPGNQASFAYSPASPTAGQTVTVQVTDSSPWVYVDLQAVGPNTLDGTWVGVNNNGNGTWTWTWTLSGLIAGDYALRFTSDNGTQLRGQTTMQVGGSTSANNALFQLSPPNPAPGQEITVRVTSTTGYGNIALQVDREGSPLAVQESGYVHNDDYYPGETHTWIYTIPASQVQQGLHNLTFTADNGSTVVDQTTMPVQGRSMRAITNSPFGFNGHFWWTYNCGTVGDRIQRFIDEYHDLGANTIRIGLDWKTIESSQGSRNYAYYDELLTRFHDAGIRVIGLFYTAPNWATIDGQEWNPGKQLNRSKVNAMRATAQNMAQRYPFINHWEFWNEPQHHSIMANGEEFAFWFQNFSEAIKAVNFQDKVSFGTILGAESVPPGGPGSPHTASFVKNVMTALQGYQPDAISLHPYGGYDVNKPQVENVHSLVPHIPLWITEFGWSNYSEGDQTNALEGAINWLRSRSYIEFSTMHMLHNFDDDLQGTHCNFMDDTTPAPTEGNHGLVTKEFYQNDDYDRREAWYKFRELARGLSCDPPSSPTASSVTASSAQVTWPAISGASLYQVAYKPSAAVSGWQYVTTSATNLTLTGLEAQTEYVFLVKTYCTALDEWSSFSENAYFTTTGCLPPSNLYSYSITSSSASVSWSPVGGASQYQVAYKPSAAVDGWQLVTTSNNYTSLTGLNAGTQYVFVVQAYCSTQGGWTSYSSNAYFTTQAACQSPGSMSASVGYNYATVNWKAVSGATSYHIAYKPSTAKTWSYKTVSGSSTTLTGLSPGQTYVYRIRSYCAQDKGWTSYSSNRYFTTVGGIKIGPIDDIGPVLDRSAPNSPSASGEEFIIPQRIDASIYPNPAPQGVAILNIEAIDRAYLMVDLYDPTGRKVKSLWQGSVDTGHQQLELGLSGIKSGLYLLQVQLGENTRTLQLVVE
ncbi:MAG TPA: hypothetical protein DCE41_24030 [Cytophagales bacterium]|nr:hypothetical protein [Cytophagales bacterium]